MPEFTEVQRIAIVEILEINRASLESQIVFLGSRVTQAVIDRVQVLTTSWNGGIGSKFVKIRPNTRNFGAEIDPDAAREQIRTSIANLLEFPDWGSSAHQFTYLERG